MKLPIASKITTSESEKNVKHHSCVRIEMRLRREVRISYLVHERKSRE